MSFLKMFESVKLVKGEESKSRVNSWKEQSHWYQFSELTQSYHRLPECCGGGSRLIGKARHL